MSRGDLQEMEVGTKQSKTAVNANAKAGMPSQNFSGSITPGQTGGWEDLGGPDPTNYRSTDDSSKLKTPGATLKQVSDVVTNRKGKTGAMGVQPSSKGIVGEDEEFEYDEDEELLEASKASDDDEEEEDESGKGKKKEEEDDEEEDDEEDDENGKKKTVKESRKAKKKKEEDDDDDDDDEEDLDEGFDIEEDVNALLAGEELSEEFQEKARTIFEAALRSKVSDIKEALEEQYAVALAEEVEEIKSELSERVDSYLEYVSEEWFTENQLVIENGLKSELTESFLQNLKGLFEDHYVTIPEDKYDVLESMVEKLDEMEEKLNEQIEKNISLNKRLAESVADGILDQVSEGLADTQKDKLASLSESVEFESEEEYREKLETLKEAYFPSRNGSPRAKTETLSEGVGTPESISGSMATYLKTAGSLFSK